MADLSDDMYGNVSASNPENDETFSVGVKDMGVRNDEEYENEDMDKEGGCGSMAYGGRDYLRGGSCGSAPMFAGGSVMSKAARLLSSDWMKALLVVFVVLMLFSLYHYAKNKMQMRKYGMPSLRRRFPHFSSSRP